MPADDRVMLRLDAQGTMLVSNDFDRRAQRRQVVDIRGIGANGAGQRPLLPTGVLMCLVEIRLDEL